jgi:hypothetical protein
VRSKFDRPKVALDFADAVNMTAVEIAAWLKTSDSRKVGWKGTGGARSESVGHASGRHIIEILRKEQADLTDEDYAHMRKVVGFIRRHSAQRPDNIYTSRWRYSLMNWGHDPTQESPR